MLGVGGYIVELEQRGHVVTGAFAPEVAVTRPEAIRALYYEMKNAGSELLQVMASYGSHEKQARVYVMGLKLLLLRPGGQDSKMIGEGMACQA